MRALRNMGSHRARLAWLALAVPWVLGACSVQAFESADAEPTVLNECETDLDCGEGAVCGPGTCVAAHGELSNVLVAIVPPASAFYGAGDSFLVGLDDVATADFSRLLTLPEYAKVVGRVAPTLEVPTSCGASYESASDSLAVHVELTRSDATWGIPAATYETNSTLTAEGWAFELPVPSGVYDIYVASFTDCAAEFPPVLVRQVELRGPGEVPYQLNVGKPAKLEGTATVPGGDARWLIGWTVSLVEPREGRLVSTVHTWDDASDTTFELYYQALEGGDSPLVKVTPPEGSIAPTIMWDLSVVDLDGNGEVGLDLSSLDLATVHVRASLVEKDAAAGQIAGLAGASVQLRSLALTNASPGLSARFQTSVAADGLGAVDVDLLPGRYRVVVVPPDQSALAMTTDEWLIAPTPAEQAGRTIEVEARPSLTGWVRDPLLDEPIESTTVSVTPSAVAPQSFLERTISPAAAPPRPGSGFTDSDGRFEIAVDPGSYDLAVQPRSDAGFPWLVRSRIKVPNEGLGSMKVSFPVPIAGVLRDPSGNAVQQALLRVYAPLDASGATSSAPSLNTPSIEGVLQVAEAQTDENGKFRLLLPATIR